MTARRADDALLAKGEALDDVGAEPDERAGADADAAGEAYSGQICTPAPIWHS